MFTWDDAKRELNLAKHGLDFEDAGLVFDSPNKLTLESPREGENRKLDIACVMPYEIVLVLVYLERGRDVRVISLRRASRAERILYERAIASTQE